MDFIRSIKQWAVQKWEDLDKNPDWLIPREEWGAKPDSMKADGPDWDRDYPEDYVLEWPVDYVIIHTNRMVDDPGEDSTKIRETIREIQEIDMDHMELNDIGYNFIVGQDGLIYEGRGWTKEGMHTEDYNHNSIGVAFLGDFEENPPSSKMVEVTMRLVEEGMRKGYLSADVRVVTHAELVRHEGEEIPCPARRLKEAVEVQRLFVPDVNWSEYGWAYDLKRWSERLPGRLSKYKEDKIKEFKHRWKESVFKHNLYYIWHN